MTTMRLKSLSALREGRVVISRAESPSDDHRPILVEAIVHSSRRDGTWYVVDLRGGEWACTGRRICQQPCAHVAAVQLVTGHKSPAALRAAGPTP